MAARKTNQSAGAGPRSTAGGKASLREESGRQARASQAEKRLKTQAEAKPRNQKKSKSLDHEVPAQRRSSRELVPPRGRANQQPEPGAPRSTLRGSRAAKAPSGAAAIVEGAKAPTFELCDQAGGKVSSAQLRGQPYVLYFYPKDNTSGCTREACDFRDSHARFEAVGVRVLGVSPDSEQSHSRFVQKFSLPFTLLADPEKILAVAYGVWVKKRNYGREYMGIERSTFYVDEAGIVRGAWRGVRVAGHVESVLQFISQS